MKIEIDDSKLVETIVKKEWKKFIFVRKFSIDFRAEVIIPGNFK